MGQVCFLFLIQTLYSLNPGPLSGHTPLRAYRHHWFSLSCRNWCRESIDVHLAVPSYSAIISDPAVLGLSASGKLWGYITSFKFLTALGKALSSWTKCIGGNNLTFLGLGRPHLRISYKERRNSTCSLACPFSARLCWVHIISFHSYDHSRRGHSSIISKIDKES